MGKGSRTRNAAQGREATKSQAATPKRSTGATVRNIFIALLVVAFVAVGAYGLLTKNVLMHTVTAMTVGEQEINAKQYKIAYKTNEMNFVSSYGSTLEMYYGVDLSRPLSGQAYGNGTWGDYLHQMTQSSLTDTYALYADAMANGAQPLAEDDPAVTGRMAVYSALADQYDMELDEYIKSVYGGNVKLDDLKEMAVIEATAEKYHEDYIESLGISDSDVDARYNDNPSAYLVADYRLFSIPYETVNYTEPAEGEEPEEGAPTSAEEATRMTEDNRAAAQAKADEFLSKVTDEQSFIELAREYASEDEAAKYEDDDATLTKDASLANFESNLVLTWCASSDTEPGDTNAIDVGTGVSCVYFIDRRLPEVRTASVRHILVRASAAADDATDEEKAEAEAADAEAKAKIEAIYDEWKSGDMSEESFASLAYENSADIGSVVNGGLIEDFSEGTMVTEFNDWVFDADRKLGDTEIVKTTYGYHLIYFIDFGESEWRVNCRNTIESEKYQEFITDLHSKYAVETNNYGVRLTY